MDVRTIFSAGLDEFVRVVAVRAANDHHQQKQDRLRKRERTWRDETGQCRLQAAGKTGRRRGQHEGGRAHGYRADPDATRRGWSSTSAG